MHACAAERFRIDHLSGGALHQVRPAESHETGALHHDDAVAQRGQVRAPRDARPHHGGDLRNAQLAAHQRIVEEDAARAVLSRKDPVLVGQIDARRIHQVHDRQAIAHGDFLRAQNLGDGFRPPRARLHRGVVGHDHGGAALDAAEPGDHSRRRAPGPRSGRTRSTGRSPENVRRGRSNRRIRSRAVILPDLCWRSMRASPPPSRRRASSV